MIAYKFLAFQRGDILAIDRIKEIHEALPETLISLCMVSSSITSRVAKIINLAKTGGNIVELMAFLLSNWLRAIRHSVR